jgi:hypothetical protein
LAGSERRSSNIKDPLVEKEATFINKSLTTLGRIFNMLSDRKPKNSKQVPPYRES